MDKESDRKRNNNMSLLIGVPGLILYIAGRVVQNSLISFLAIVPFSIGFYFYTKARHGELKLLHYLWILLIVGFLLINAMQ